MEVAKFWTNEDVHKIIEYSARWGIYAQSVNIDIPVDNVVVVTPRMVERVYQAGVKVGFEINE